MASPQTSFCTIRLFGIPIGFDFNDLRQLLCATDQSQILHWSLATSHLYSNKPSETATITFRNRTLDLEKLLSDGRLCTSLDANLKDSIISVDETFYGLTALNEIEDDTTGINLIAITGLGGKAFTSWQYSNGAMWLRDFLPRDVPGIKVYIYGYPSKLYKSHSQAGILDYTTIFVDELLNNLSIFKNKPLILVGHSLGCLIIKKALVDHRNKLADIVYSVVFFGAPNQGLDTSALLTLYAGEQSERLLRDLTPGSTILTDLHKSFTATQDRLRIVSCFETQTTPTSVRPTNDPKGEPKRIGESVMMVSQQSACFYTKNEEQVPIDLNHSMIAKLSELPGSAYYTIARHLKAHAFGITQLWNGGTENTPSQSPSRLINEVAKKVIFFGQIPDHTLFVGRSEILNEISEIFFKAKRKPSVVSIHGLGGSGKTHVASKFAVSNLNKYQSVIWINARSEQEIKQGFTQLARVFLNDATVDSIQECAPPVLSWLEQLPHRWLMIFDNVDDVELLQSFSDRFIPKFGDGDILLTSRLRDSAELGHSIEIIMLPEADATSMLLEITARSGDEEVAAANTVVNTLGCLPLAIAQAGAYIRNECIPTDRYLRHYHSQTRELEVLGYTNRVSWPYRQSSATTWIASFQAVEKKNSAAAHWLVLCCFLDRTIFQDIFALALSPGSGDQRTTNQPATFPDWLTEVCCKDGVWDELTFNQMTTEVHQYSLMKKSVALNNPISFQFHPIVQEVCKLRLSSELQQKFTSVAINLIERAISNLSPRNGRFEDETISYLLQRRLGLHIDACYGNAKRFFPDNISQSSGTPWTFAASRQFARFYWHEGRWQIAEDLQRLALSMCPANGNDFVNVMRELAATLRKRGIYQEAADLQQLAINNAQSLEQRLSLMNELASTYRDLGNLGDAISLQETVVLGWHERVAERSPPYISAQASLATLYYKADRFLEAVKIEEMVLRIRQEDLGEENLNTVTAMDNLATTHWRLERYSDAEILEQKAVEIRVKLLGEDHLETIRAKGHLSATFRKQHRYPEALALIQEVVAKKRELFGRDDPNTARSARHLYKTLVCMHREADASVVRRDYGLTV